MTKLQELYEQLEQVKDRKPKSLACAMERHQQLVELQREIDYYELGETLSRSSIQQEVTELHAIQEEINRLTALLADKKRNLMNTVFGEHVKLP